MSKSKGIKESRSFRIHNAAIRTIITAQAGSLQKALLEAVMNSMDAGSTRVQVYLDKVGFRIVDDGRGFASHQEIDEFFETFGTPHTEGDATFGTFRMGRGQMFAFASTVWRTGEFEMEVNFSEDGEGYTLTHGLEKAPGCVINAKLYEPMSSSELLMTHRHLAQMVAYVDIPVEINGENVAQKHLTEKWSFEDKYAYYKLDANRSMLDVYNLGVLVNSRHTDYGVGGVIVSKTRLTLNMARNDILLSQCQVWKEIRKKIREHSDKVNNRQKSVRNEAWRRMMCARLIASDVSSIEAAQELWLEPILTDISGKHLSLTELLVKSTPICYEDGVNTIRYDKAHVSSLAHVLSQKTRDRLGNHLTLRQAFMAIAESVKAAAQEWGAENHWAVKHVLGYLEQAKGRCINGDDIISKITDRHEPVGDNQLAAKQKAVLNVIRGGFRYIVSGARRVNGSSKNLNRSIIAGKSESAQAWTDAERAIWVNINLLNIPANKAAAFRHFNRLATLLIHEICHNEDNQSTNVHGAEFYENFEHICCDTDAITDFVSSAMKAWTDYVKKEIKKPRAGDMELIDRVDEWIGDTPVIENQDAA